MSTDVKYGEEVIVDLHECDPRLFYRENIERFMEHLCGSLGMQRCDLHFWDDVGVPEDECQTEPHLKGTSAIQFITTSNITIHTLDLLGNVYLNVFSCKEVDEELVKNIALRYFRGKVVESRKLVRL